MSEVSGSVCESAKHVELKLYRGIEFFEQLAADIATTSAGDRVAILTMCFEPQDPWVAVVMDELYAAADRKVDVAIGVDAYTFLVNTDEKSVGPLFLPQPLRQSSFSRRLSALEALSEKPSASYGIINKPSRLLANPFAGRSHLKMAIINDKVWIEGANFHRTNRLDLAVCFEDVSTADWLYGISKEIIKTESTSEVLGGQDQSWQVDDSTRILIDSGQPNQSLILDEAFKIIDDAEEFLFVTYPNFPDSSTMRRLVAANDRGIEVYFVHNHPSCNGFLEGLVRRMASYRQRRSMPEHFRSGELPLSSPELHAKAIASEATAMVGTHNFVSYGVNLGTPEITLHSQNPTFVHQVGKFISTQVQLQKVPTIVK